MKEDEKTTEEKLKKEGTNKQNMNDLRKTTDQESSSEPSQIQTIDENNRTQSEGQQNPGFVNVDKPENS